MKIKSHFGTYDLILNKNFSVSKKKNIFILLTLFLKKKITILINQIQYL